MKNRIIKAILSLIIEVSKSHYVDMFMQGLKELFGMDNKKMDKNRHDIILGITISIFLIILTDVYGL